MGSGEEAIKKPSPMGKVAFAKQMTDEVSNQTFRAFALKMAQPFYSVNGARHP